MTAMIEDHSVTPKEWPSKTVNDSAEWQSRPWLGGMVLYMYWLDGSGWIFHNAAVFSKHAPNVGNVALENNGDASHG